MTKPTLTLPKKPAPAPKTPETNPRFGSKLHAIIFEELERAEYNKRVTFEAVMARITADQEFYQELALNQIRRLCRKRIKRFNQARTLTEQATKMIMPTHARLWRRMPSPFDHVNVWASVMGPFSYVVTYNSQTLWWVASVKRLQVEGPATCLGSFSDNTAAYEACEKHYRANLS